MARYLSIVLLGIYYPKAKLSIDSFLLPIEVSLYRPTISYRVLKKKYRTSIFDLRYFLLTYPRSTIYLINPLISFITSLR